MKVTIVKKNKEGKQETITWLNAGRVKMTPCYYYIFDNDTMKIKKCAIKDVLKIDVEDI